MNARATDAAVLEQFLDMLAAERGASENTLSAYRRDLEDLTGFIAKKGGALASADSDLLRAYLKHQDSRGMALSTQSRRLSAVRQFYKFLFAEGLRGDDPSQVLDSPRQAQRLPKNLSEKDVDALLQQARTQVTGGDDMRGLRLVALLELVYATGLRVTELVSLPENAIRDDSRVIFVRGKGGRERMVPVGESARLAVDAYLPARQAWLKAQKKQSSFLFPAVGKDGHLSRIRFVQLLKELAEKAGLDPRKVSPHVLRHAFATHLLSHGADLRAIQQMLGHANITTTEIYTFVLEERLKKLVSDHHPLARRGS